MQDKDSRLLEVKHGWTWPEQMAIRLSRIKTLPMTLYLLLKLQLKRQKSTAQSNSAALLTYRKLGRGESLNQTRYTHTR